MPPGALAQVVRDLPKSSDPRLIVGTAGFSDAGVFEIAPNLLMVQSLDFFAPLVDDPYIFGQIAAANSLSDIYAMGATALTALNIVCFPDDTLELGILSEILRGGTDKVHEAGAVIVGGHSIRDPEIKYGLSVTGVVSREHLITNNNAKPGDLLMLTKRLGTGFVTTAMKKGKCPEEVQRETLREMASLNKIASEAARQFRASAATDITGFGLAVHSCEMANASDVSLHIELDKLPLLPGAMDFAARNFLTRANKTNREFCQDQLLIDKTANQTLLQMVFDPQTSGGLLISVPEERADDLADQLNSQGSTVAQVIGSVQHRQDFVLQVS